MVSVLLVNLEAEVRLRCTSLLLSNRPLTGDDEPSFIAETSFVRAPLNSRVTSNTAIPKAKGKAKQDSLDHMPLEIQEAVILEDLLYVLMVSCSLLS
jgi:hypothetical protein